MSSPPSWSRANVVISCDEHLQASETLGIPVLKLKSPLVTINLPVNPVAHFNGNNNMVRENSLVSAVKTGLHSTPRIKV